MRKGQQAHYPSAVIKWPVRKGGFVDIIFSVVSCPKFFPVACVIRTVRPSLALATHAGPGFIEHYVFTEEHAIMES